MIKENKFKSSKNYLYRIKNADTEKIKKNFNENKSFGIKYFFVLTFSIIIKVTLTIGYSIVFFAGIIAMQDISVYSLNQSHFNIQTIEIFNNAIVSKEDILRAIKLSSNASFLTLDLEEIKKDIIKLDNIKNVDIKRKLPGKLTIEIDERNPLFTVSGLNTMLDDEGKSVKIITMENKFKNLPLLKGIKINNNNDVLDTELIKYLAIVDIEAKFYKKFGYELLKINDIDSTNDWVDFNLENNIKIRFAYEADWLVFEKLKAVLKDMHNKGIKPSYIDLQFKDVVVKL